MNRIKMLIRSIDARIKSIETELNDTGHIMTDGQLSLCAIRMQTLELVRDDAELILEIDDGWVLG